ncbi:hypothetical protein IJI72_02700 [Candidatus Saccharibacteria bacterium]|nr:hypothetical protein [Candidatus Saccharibacteria bacterium]
MKKFVVFGLLVFGAGFLTCYGVFVDKDWWSGMTSFLRGEGAARAKLAMNDCDKVVAEIEKYDWDTKVATAVMKAETKCDINAKGDTDLVFEENGRQYGYSVGAFQVRILPGREECDTYDLETNVRCSYEIYVKAGREFTDWSMYLNGKYHEYLDLEE